MTDPTGSEGKANGEQAGSGEAQQPPASPEQSWPAPPTGLMPVVPDAQSGASAVPPPAYPADPGQPQAPAAAGSYPAEPGYDAPRPYQQHVNRSDGGPAFPPAQQQPYPQQPYGAAPAQGQPPYGATGPQQPYTQPTEQYPTAQQPYAPGQAYPAAGAAYATGQQQYATGQQPYATGQQPYAQPGQPGGQPPKKKRSGLLWGLVGGGALLLVLIVAGIITFATMSASHAPQATVGTFLDQLKAGKAEEALKTSNTPVTSADVLLTDKVYSQVKDKITGYSVLRTVTSGDGAVVDVRVTQPSGAFEQQFQLKQDGTDLLFFPKWVMQPLALGQAQVQVGAPTSAKVTIAGVESTPKKSQITLKALPGQYPVSLASSQYYTAPASVAEVAGFAQAPSKPASLAATLTAAGSKAATDAINDYVNSCVASTDPTPAGCPIGLANASDFANYSNVKWTLVAAPQFTVDSKWSTGWAVTTTVQGSVNFSANATDPDGSNPGVVGFDSPEPFDVGGAITDFTSSGAKYTPSLQDLLNNL
jgi:hypothetical protein